MKYSVPKEISIVIHNGSNYDYHFIIKEFIFLGENTEKYIAFSVPIQKEITRIEKTEAKLQKPYPANYHLLKA